MCSTSAYWRLGVSDGSRCPARRRVLSRLGFEWCVAIEIDRLGRPALVAAQIALSAAGRLCQTHLERSRRITARDCFKGTSG